MIEELLMNYGYISLFLSSFLGSTILPLGSEGLVLLMIIKKFNLLAIAIVASLGNIAGGITCYWMGYKGRSDRVLKFFRISNERFEKYEKLFAKYGVIVLLFSWLPIMGDIIIISSGILKYKFLYFITYVFIGKFGRYLILIYGINGLLGL